MWDSSNKIERNECNKIREIMFYMFVNPRWSSAHCMLSTLRGKKGRSIWGMINILHLHVWENVKKWCGWKWFCENIHQFVFRAYWEKFNDSLGDFVTYEIQCLVHSWNIGFEVICHVAWLSQKRFVWCLFKKPMSSISWYSQQISTAPSTNAWYFASTDDCDTIGCFFDFQDISESPKNM